MWKNVVINPFKYAASTAFLTGENLLAQQSRNTFILKRKWPPGLAKRNQKAKSLKARHFVYDFVEDTNVRKQQNLDVILTEYVEGVGQKGDRISLKPNVAYNKLLLPKLAVYATPENIEKYATKEEDGAGNAQQEHSSPFAQRTIDMLSRLTLAVVMNKDTPWVLEPWHIRASLRKSGYHVAEDAITMPEKEIKGPDMSIQGKEFFVTVTVNNLEKTQVRCRIHHWSTVPSERLPYVFEHWKQPAEPIFSESENTSA